MSQKAQELAESLCDERDEIAADWTPHLELVLEAGMTEKTALRLGRAAGRVEIFAGACRFLQSLAGQTRIESAWQELLLEVDDSDYSLEDWLLAIHAAEAWLKSCHRVVSARDILSYIGCSAEAASTQPAGRSLRSLLVDYLRDYGIDNAQTRPSWGGFLN